MEGSVSSRMWEENSLMSGENRRITESVHRDKIRTIGFIVLVVLIMTSGALIYAWSSLNIVHIGYEMAQALNERKNLIEINKRLKVELAILRSPDRIEAVAVHKLGMRTPKSHEFIIIK